MSQNVGPRRLSDTRQLYWKGCVYGLPGVGKTIFASTSQKHRTFVIDIDDGVNSADAFLTSNKLSKDLCTIYTITSTQEFTGAMNYLSANMDKFDIVVIDSATELQRLIIQEVCNMSKHQTPDQRDWGIIRSLMENIILNFRHMSKHFVMVCHEINKLDPDMNRDVYRPSFDGRTAFEYAKHLSWIARYVISMKSEKQPSGETTQTIMRALDFGPTPYAHYKDRSGMMQRYEYPNLDAILEKMANSTTTSEEV